MKTYLRESIDAALKSYVTQRLPAYGLRRVHPLLEDTLAEFIQRPGKRVRPLLFGLSYLGHAARRQLPADVLRGCLGFELLHDFLLVHDDIIDNSPLRRGRPTMHMVFKKSLRLPAKTGQDLALVAADILYAMAVDIFLDIRASSRRKEQALRLFLQATIATGAGEYKDVLNGYIPLSRISRHDIRQNYRLKTAQYSFSAPLACGCLIAGGSSASATRLQRAGLLLGEAFQIHDDMLGIFGRSCEIGKSVLSDIAEAKKTLPLWFAYERASAAERRFLNDRLGNPALVFNDVRKIRLIIKKTAAGERTAAVIKKCIVQAHQLLAASSLARPVQRELKSMINGWFPGVAT